jgi:hypothetical protein
MHDMMDHRLALAMIFFVIPGNMGNAAPLIPDVINKSTRQTDHAHDSKIFFHGFLYNDAINIPAL